MGGQGGASRPPRCGGLGLSAGERGSWRALIALSVAAAVDPVACGLVFGPPSTSPGRSRSDELDLDLVLIVYGVLVELRVRHLRRTAPYCDRRRRSRGLFTTANIVVNTRCRGPRRHAHRAIVSEHADDLR